MNSEFINGLFLNRRGALKTLSGLSVLAASTGAFGKDSQGSADDNTPPLDFNDSHDNLYAFGKIWAGFDGPQ